VAEQLLDLAQVGARVEELGGEDVAERLRRDALRSLTPAAFDVVAKDLPELDVWTPTKTACSVSGTRVA